VLGTGTETLPGVISSDGVLTFKLTTPIPVTSGDTFAVSATSAGNTVNCVWNETSGTDEVFAAAITPPPTIGQSVNPFVSIPAELADLAVILGPASQDVSVSATTGPGNAQVGNEALLSATVTNGGPGTNPITFTDTVPTGLTIDAVAAAGGSCTTKAQVVTCTVSGLAVGASAPVEIVVTPTAQATYQNSVSVSAGTGVTDPNAANNNVSAH
jgi:hypothetical protein